ncbi:MAG TPA: GlsB/YeaQ/YmgE family stress response membrane protein [Myxococcales bacterium]|nr:GlsB/YeaQ/YmgE family stress response membrane protein [Myxococcales bacterium]
MSVVAWLLLGLISGFIASKLVGGSGGLFIDMLLGVVGGAAFHLIGEVGVTGLNLWSIFVSVVGAAIVLVAHHAISGRRATS